MKQYLTEQIKNNPRVTEDALSQGKLYYSSKREVKVGDQFFFIYVQDKDDENNLELISVHEEELENYEYVKQEENNFIPITKLKW